MGWGGYGKGGYGWGWPPMMMMPWGKGKGKAGSVLQKDSREAFDTRLTEPAICDSISVQGLRGFANEKKVWIGGLPAGPTSIETNKKLKEHMSQAGTSVGHAPSHITVTLSTRTSPDSWIPNMSVSCFGGHLAVGPGDNCLVISYHTQAGECIFAEINKNGIAGAAYKTPEEVQKAVETLNGTVFEGHTLEVDIWQKKTPEAPPPSPPS